MPEPVVEEVRIARVPKDALCGAFTDQPKEGPQRRPVYPVESNRAVYHPGEDCVGTAVDATARAAEPSARSFNQRSVVWRLLLGRLPVPQRPPQLMGDGVAVVEDVGVR
jgi:hypothetical protein